MRLERFLRRFAERVKAVFTHKSKGFTDLIYLATAIVSVVITAVIGVYIASQIYGVMNLETTSPFQTAMNSAVGILNTTLPLVSVAVIAVIAGTIMVYLMGGLGIGGEKKGEK